jgi:hypothetical protein
MDILPVLTPRFLGYCHHGDDDSNDVDPPTSPWQEFPVGVPPSTSPSDNTHKYLTARWSYDVVSDFIPPTTSHYERNLLPANDVDVVVPMWISPSTSMLPTPASSFSPATALPPQHLLKLPSLAVPPLSPTSTESIFSRKCLIDVPAVIFIRLQQQPQAGMTSATYSMFVEDNDDDVVSVLADNPDEDDVAVLPLATYDVLANILDDIYKDEGEVIDGEVADHDETKVVCHESSSR